MATDTDTPWARASAWQQEGVSPADIAARLKASGVDDESVQVVIASMAPPPAPLPEAHFELATNSMLPRLFAISDLGLEGDRRTVALYWATFGLLFGGLSVVGWAVGGLNLFDGGPWAQFAQRALPWLGVPVAIGALARAAFLLLRRT